MSGATSYLGLDLAGSHWMDALIGLAIILGFVLGAALAGFLIGARQLMPGRRYGLALLGEGALLALGMDLLLGQRHAGLALVAMACGLQNAMTSSYCGLIIRTTHVTGTVTDIGVMLGHWLRHRQIERHKLRFLLAVLAAFAGGIVLGAWVDGWIGSFALGLPAAGCLVAGIIIWLSARRGWLNAALIDEAKPPRTASFPER